MILDAPAEARMPDERYFKGALVLPLILAVIGVASIPLTPELPAYLFWVIGPLRTFALFGGIPYLLFVVGIAISLARGRRFNWPQLTLLAPLYLLGIFWSCALAFDILASRSIDPRGWVEGGLIFGAFVLGVGYIYAGMVFLIRFIVRSAGNTDAGQAL